MSKTFKTIIESYLNRKVFTNDLCQYAGAIGAATIGYKKLNVKGKLYKK